MKDFIGFKFGNIHTKDLNLVVVSSSDRYQKNLLPDPKDYTVEVPGGDGSYYFGQTYNNREFSCEVAFDNVTEDNWRKISQLFSTDKLQDLVFDELPYKTYKAKLRSKPEFKFICFTDRETGERVYKGEGTLNFICYFPYAFCFDKYIVRAADYYNTTPPETIIRTYTEAEDEYANNLREPVKKHTREYYKVDHNMGSPWQGGYPTIEQVQNGELFFTGPNGEQKTIVTVRDYWTNVPEWAPSSRLLTTPTLDFDQELIYMPQYSRESYVNMDIGITQDSVMIGNRFLVYNPGDLPIEFDMDLFNKERTFHTGRGNRFQIRRFNVDRMPIHMAVDYTGLKTYKIYDDIENERFKYGKKYFKGKRNGVSTTKIDFTDYYNLDPTDSADYEKQKKIIEDLEKEIQNEVEKNVPQELGDAHPNHTYLVEPFAREKLGWYIRLFFLQSSYYIVDANKRHSFYEEGCKFAERYEELFNLCKTDYEEYELYWKTLKDLFYRGYSNKKIFKDKTLVKGIILHGDDKEETSNDEKKSYLLQVRLQNFNKDDGTIEETERITLKEVENNYIDNLTEEDEKEFYKDGLFVFKDYHDSQDRFYKLVVEEQHPVGAEQPELKLTCQPLTQRDFKYYFDGAIDGEQLYFQLMNVSNNAATKYYQIHVIQDKYYLFRKIGSPAIFDHSFERFYYNFIYNPPEFIRRPFDADYDQFEFNDHTFPQWHSYDYLEISTDDMEDSKLFLNTEKHILYNENYTYDIYQPKTHKVLQNDGILKGKWFKIPPGWSMIEIIPVCEKNNWGEKRWLDARAFDWGYGGLPNCNKQPIQIVFDAAYDCATKSFLTKMGVDENEEYYLQIRRWFEVELERYKVIEKDGKILGDQFAWEYYKNLEVQLEYELLKTIAAYWNAQKGLTMSRDIGEVNPITGEQEQEVITIAGTIDEWWWYACNYIWANFPPLYWSYVDILDRAKIYYTPLFY